MVTSGDGSLSIACDFGETHIRTVGRSLRKATSSFVAARARAAITGTRDDQETATVRRLEFDNQVEAVSAFTRAAAKKEAPVSHLKKVLEEADKAVEDGPEGETSAGQTHAEIHLPPTNNLTQAYEDDQTITSDEDEGTSTMIGGGVEAPDTDGPDYDRSYTVTKSQKSGSVEGSQRSLSPAQIAANHARRDASLDREEETVTLQSELEMLKDEMERRDATMRRDLAEMERRDAATRREFHQKEAVIKARLKLVEKKRRIAQKRDKNDSARDEAMSQASGSETSDQTMQTALTSVSQRSTRPKQPTVRSDAEKKKPTNSDKPKADATPVKPASSRRTGETTPSPRANGVAAWAEDAASRTSRNDLENDRASLADVVTSAAAAAAVAAVNRQSLLTQSNTSIYELVKLIERRRPTVKFAGDSKVVDFEDHFITFKRSVDLPGLPSTWKLAEIPHWFDGVARIHINRFLRREDTDKAFDEAMARLRREFGRKAATADEMLTDVLKGNKIDSKDAIGANLFISRVEEIFHLALETKREDDFNRRSIYKRILAMKLPHLKSKWGAFVGKNDEKTMTFVEFLEFLTISRRIATECDDLDDEPVETTKTFATVVKDVAKENVGSDGFEVVRRKGGSRWPRSFDSTKVANDPPPTSSEKPEGGDRRPRPLECFCCKQEHFLQYCPKYIGCTPTERVAIVKEKLLCHRCLGKGHHVKDCLSRVRCHCGDAGHHPTTHEGRGGPIAAAPAAPASTAGVASES